MGLIGMAFGIGFILGPAMGGALAKIPVEGRHGVVPCLAAAALSAVNFAWAALGLVESLPADKRASTPRRSLAPLNVDAMKFAFRLPGVALAVAVNFLLILSFTSLDQTFTFFCVDLFAIDERGTGYVLAFMGVVAAGVQGGVIRPLAKRFDEAWLIRVGVALQAIAFAGFVLAATAAITWGPHAHEARALLFASGALLAIGNGLTQPSTSAFISRRAPAHAQGGTLGTNQSFASLARTFGPAVGGWLYGEIGHRAPYAGAVLGMIVALALAFGLVRRPEDQRVDA
jgi:MFS family permease